MSAFPLRAAVLGGALTLCVTAGDASAQWVPAGPNCFCRQPVPVTTYRTVPVTEYQQVRRTVRRPVVETEWEDREVTAYRPVTEQKVAKVPSVSYDAVTEYQTQYQNAGYWTTTLQHNPKMLPCQYDPRPTLGGFLNRTAYSIRSLLTPSVIPRRQYVGGTVAQTVPVTRYVARPETREVTYNETKLVPYTTRKKVAVRTVKYVNEEVVTTQPVTVMRTVPAGTRMAYAPAFYGALPTRTVLAPAPTTTARPSEAPSRTANSQDNRFGTESKEQKPDFGDGEARYEPKSEETRPAVDLEKALAGWVVDKQRQAAPARTVVPAKSNAIARANHWFVRSPRAAQPAGPALAAPELALAKNNR